MGVSGAGKTTIGLDLANELSAFFLDADVFHSEANISKMKSGRPLSDADRWSWILALNNELVRLAHTRKNIVLACSALKESYRKSLFKDIHNYLIIYLQADIDILKKRHLERKNHFFNPSLLESQIEILEPPKDKFISLDTNQSRKAIIKEIISRINDY